MNIAQHVLADMILADLQQCLEALHADKPAIAQRALKNAAEKIEQWKSAGDAPQPQQLTIDINA